MGRGSVGVQVQWRLRIKGLRCSVDFPASADLDHPYGQLGILYRIDDTVISLAKPVFFLAGELFAAKGPGICGKAAYARHDPMQGGIKIHRCPFGECTHSSYLRTYLASQRYGVKVFDFARGRPLNSSNNIPF